MPAWPTGPDVKIWMRSAAIGVKPDDDQRLAEIAPAAIDEIRGMCDEELLAREATVTTAALAANVATLTVDVSELPSKRHDITVGETVTVSGSTNSVFDGEYVVTAVTRTTISYAKVNADIASAASAGTVSVVDGCPPSVALAVKIRAAALYTRRDAPNGVVTVTPEQVFRIMRHDADVERLISRYAFGDDPVMA